jgi:hypothetical protein
MKSIALLILVSFGFSLGSYSAGAQSMRSATLLEFNNTLRAGNAVAKYDAEKTTLRVGKRVIKKYDQDLSEKA